MFLHPCVLKRASDENAKYSTGSPFLCALVFPHGHRGFWDQIHIELTQHGSSKNLLCGTRPNGT